MTTVTRRSLLGGMAATGALTASGIVAGEASAATTSRLVLALLAATATALAVLPLTAAGKRYVLTSAPFTVTAGAILTPEVHGTTVRLRYPWRWSRTTGHIARPRPTAARSPSRSTAAPSWSASRPATSRSRKVCTSSFRRGGAHDRYGNTDPDPSQIR